MTRGAFLRNAKRAGLTARAGADLYSARRLSGACEAVQGRLQAKRRELRRRIAALEARHEEVTRLLLECWRQDRREDCRVRWTLAAPPKKRRTGPGQPPGPAER